MGLLFVFTVVLMWKTADVAEGGAHLHKNDVITNIYFPSANILQLRAIFWAYGDV